MNQRDAMLSRSIRRSLDARARSGVPEETDLWPRVQRAYTAEMRVCGSGRAVLRSGRRLIYAVAVCAVLVTSGAAIAAAASPSLRHFLQETVLPIPVGHAGAGLDVHGQPLQIQPLPSFTVFYPASQPDGLLIRGVGQFHPRYGADGFGWRYDCPTPPAPCPPGITVFTPAHPAVGLPSLLAPFAGKQTDVVWFGSHGIPPDGRFIQIVEWDAATSPVKSLSPTAISLLDPREPETLLEVSRAGTTIAIDTNLGGSVAQQVADSLRPITQSPQQRDGP
jgi:hypothetical protein